MILSLGTSSVMLNGVPGKKFYSRRGVSHGDPLSPLLFVLAANLLQSVLNRAMIQGLLSKPIPSPCNDFPIIHYVDDTLVVLISEASQLICLKAMLNTFADSTGFRVNYHKSNMIPINLSDERLRHFSDTINYQVGSFPFTYLGLPVGLTKPSLDHFMPMVSRVLKRLCGIADFLNFGGKLHLVKYVLASLAIFFMCCMDVPITIKDQVIKYMRHRMWRKKKMMCKEEEVL
jgi:hypothetical protein